MEKISKNTLVSISMKMADTEGNLLDETDELMYLQGGYGQIFEKLEDELEAKVVGDNFDLMLAPAEAFGEYNESLVAKESLKELPEDIAIGMEFDSDTEDLVWVVEQIEDGYAILNANHELAGIPLRVWGSILELEQLSEKGVREILEMEHSH